MNRNFLKQLRIQSRRKFRRNGRFPSDGKSRSNSIHLKREISYSCKKRRFFVTIKILNKSNQKNNDLMEIEEEDESEDSDIEVIIDKMNLLFL